MYEIIQPIIILALSIFLLALNTWIFKTKLSIKNQDFLKGTISFLIATIGLISFILVLPIEKELKAQIISFLGIIFSAGIALSSTNLLGNLISGIMNNSMERFKNGDLIKINDFYGRVVKKSLFHVEVQLEDSNFVTIPNLYMANHPVKLTKKNNTIISTSVSLGYDVSRKTIEKTLIQAAKEAGLKDPYVYIISLGDYSIVYKIHGFLKDSNKFFSTKSLLNAKAIDCLHEQNIEIVSPAFMNQRKVDGQDFIPSQKIQKEVKNTQKAPEDLVFDEAIKSEKLETKKEKIQSLSEEQKQLKKDLENAKDEKEISKIENTISKKEKIKENIKTQIESEEAN